LPLPPPWPRAQPRRTRPEILAAGLSAADLDRLLTQGFTLVRTRQTALLGTTLARLTDLLARSAKDLGAPGRDPIYGWGLVQFAALPAC
jgi:hypothetical protein